MYRYLPSLIVRIIFLAMIFYQYTKGGFPATTMGLSIFVITIPIMFLAWRSVAFSVIDAFLIGLFVVAGLMTMYGSPLASTIFGLDKLFHFLGGLGCGILAYFVLKNFVSNKYVCAVLVVLCALAIGAAWEMFEWVFLLISNTAADRYDRLLFSDTMLDLIADSLGAMLVGLFVLSKAVSSKIPLKDSK